MQSSNLIKFMGEPSNVNAVNYIVLNKIATPEKPF